LTIERTDLLEKIHLAREEFRTVPRGHDQEAPLGN
jgi:hypothetical protein